MRTNYIIFLLILSIAIGCKKKYGFDDLIPDKLAELELEQVVQTNDNPFKQLLSKGHNPSSDIQARYFYEDTFADLYIARYSDTLSAIAAFHNVMKVLKTDTLQFKHVIPRFDNNVFFLMAMNNGRLYYFFTKSTYVFWLNCEKRYGEKAIKELLNFYR